MAADFQRESLQSSRQARAQLQRKPADVWWKFAWLALLLGAVALAADPGLHLVRFNGTEVFRVKSAEFNFYREAGGWETVFAVATVGPALRSLPDTSELAAEPSVEIAFRSTARPVLRSGQKLGPAAGFDDSLGVHMTNLYYVQHQPVDQALAEILEVRGNDVRVRLSGVTIDVNYYDGSKPKTRLSMEAVFVRNLKLKKSFE